MVIDLCVGMNFAITKRDFLKMRYVYAGLYLFYTMIHDNANDSGQFSLNQDAHTHAYTISTSTCLSWVRERKI